VHSGHKYGIYAKMRDCPLCLSAGGEIIWQDSLCRVVRVNGAEGAAFPGYCRVVWNAHVTEMTDLDPDSRQHLMDVVYAVESALRTLVAPNKINLAALGNMVPHLHWHVIPRWQNDSHFPQPIWARVEKEKPAVMKRPPLPPAALAAAISTFLAEGKGDT
jgi:diadenosine tetraphosphate (Ap4A) HIT family hydrolase